ncbi:unnamed protein product [Orchesella dallaii]|uniref:Uncharacterized protein n=1 Tax=Orchesella dallaii TaxID=48710 RepID=A0ABP1PKS9_9HEXA
MNSIAESSTSNFKKFRRIAVAQVSPSRPVEVSAPGGLSLAECPNRDVGRVEGEAYSVGLIAGGIHPHTQVLKIHQQRHQGNYPDVKGSAFF